MSELKAKGHGAVLLPKITGFDFTLGVSPVLGAPGAIPSVGSISVSDEFADLSAGLRLDLTTNETATTSAAVTPYPVEEGAEVSDGIIPQSRTYSIAGVQGDFAPGASEGDPGRAAALFNRLDLAVVTGELFTLVTSLRVYDNVLITNVTGTKSQGNGFALPIQIQIQEVRFATSEEVFIPAPKRTGSAGAGSERDKNRRPPTEPIDPFLNSSVASDLNLQALAGGAARLLGFSGAPVDIGAGL